MCGCVVWSEWKGDQWSVLEASRCSALELLSKKMNSVGCGGRRIRVGGVFELGYSQEKGVSYEVIYIFNENLKRGGRFEFGE